VRRTDGFHLNETGAEILALDIAEAIRIELRARGGSL
jgi:lysophospholipase L1-like esterase